MLKLIQNRLISPTNNRLIFQCGSVRQSSSVTASETVIEQVKSNPLDHYDYFGVNKLFTVKNLFDNRMHLGHTVRSLTPQMAPFVFGTRYNCDNIHS